ncbi:MULTISPECIES: fimbria/pilus chaperone family protein [unclassified Serratia (in: enterobacteria)]|uniref:fimbria/pilus chaperone family protein n=1 Tax=unclassified Serratia (in: enterobacteria) TaxID=2647522 RepID=UPI000503CB81|nr:MULTISPECIES: fimbria/pilus chaperone family protein [unclassified Serratia (in: enterobacteria)]KFK95642.1 fimbrial protein [Serratia sp. Ag2]KFL00344.1 fimbrial protein [Serratia sp. Ag1]
MQFANTFSIGLLMLSLFSVNAQASGVVPDTTVVIVEESDGEAAVNVKNTDTFPVLLLTTIENIKEDGEALLSVTPPAARVEPGKSQRVRFILTSKTPLKMERLKRVIFEGIPPQQKGKNELRTTVRQNLPVIIRPAGLATNNEPWKLLSWKLTENTLTLSNPSPYVVRLANTVQTLPDNTSWTLPNTYILPGQTLQLTPENNKKVTSAKNVRLHPATTWGFSVDSYDATLAN